MNRNYGKVDADHNIVYAPDMVAHDGRSYINPRKEDYAVADDGPWLPVIESAPSEPPPEGYHWKRTGKYDVSPDGRPMARYVAEEDPKTTLEDYDTAMEEHLLAERSARGYTTREPDMYTGSEVPRWAADAADWKKHRDAVMLYALEIMNAVQSGEREPPTLDEFVAGLPNIVWTYNEG